MSDSKKKRLSMLDNLAASAPPSPSSLMKTNRPLRAARDAVDSHKVWELDPHQINDDRVADRLDPADVADLRASIEATGQSVPILVRRHATQPDRYHLVYGRRRLEAIKSSDKVKTVRALIANMDSDAAVEAQISENMARRDLSFIEKALFAHELIESGFGNQSRVAEVLTVSKSAISMALAIVTAIGPDLIRVIGPAHGIGRPRWEILSKGRETSAFDTDTLIGIAEMAQSKATSKAIQDGAAADMPDLSTIAFEAVLAQVAPALPASLKSKPKATTKAKTLLAGGETPGKITRTAKGIQIELGGGDFADWVEDQAQALVDELHARWQQRQKDT